eukprot:SAG11_NODE_7987_length_1073_cov_1.029774_1_plen_103_part_00
MRPKTHFDYITLADLAEVFSKEVAQGRVYTKPAFRQLMREALRFTNALVSDRLYSMFDGAFASPTSPLFYLTLQGAALLNRMKSHNHVPTVSALLSERRWQP